MRLLLFSAIMVWGKLFVTVGVTVWKLGVKPTSWAAMSVEASWIEALRETAMSPYPSSRWVLNSLQLVGSWLGTVLAPVMVRQSKVQHAMVVSDLILDVVPTKLELLQPVGDVSVERVGEIIRAVIPPARFLIQPLGSRTVRFRNPLSALVINPASPAGSAPSRTTSVPVDDTIVRVSAVPVEDRSVTPVPPDPSSPSSPLSPFSPWIPCSP